MILPSAERAELEVRRDEGQCKSLRSTKNRFALLCHPSFRLVVETCPKSLESLLWASSLLTGWSRIEVDSSDSFISSEQSCLYHLRLEVWNVHHCSALLFPLRWVFERGLRVQNVQLVNVCDRNMSIPNSPAYIALHIQAHTPGKNCLTKLMEPSLVFRRTWMIFTTASNGTTGTLNVSANRLS